MSEPKDVEKHCTASQITIRPFRPTDEADVIALWRLCGLVVPQNDPKKDIACKLDVQPELFIVGVIGDRLVATVMAGYEGHRGWINYLAVLPDLRRKGIGRLMMQHVEGELVKRGCPKINLQVRSSNETVMAFYQNIGYCQDHVLSMGKRL